MTAERGQARVAVSDCRLRRIGLKSASGDDRPVEDLAQLLRGNRTLPFGINSPPLIRGSMTWR
jgi:hypothetical protein